MPKCLEGGERKLTKQTRRQRRKGQALVEFALFLPILILLLAGAADIGRQMSKIGVVCNAVRQGARYASTNPTDLGTIKTRVEEDAAGAAVTIADGDITVTCGMTSLSPGTTCTSGTAGNTGSGNPVTVQAYYRMTPIVGFHTYPIVISRQCTMRIQ